MIKKIPFLCLSFLFSALVYTQNKEKILFGEVKNGKYPLENITIINKTNKLGTYSNTDGKFKILAKIGDSLQISSVEYKTKYVILQATNFGLQQFSIQLEKQMVELDEVTVKNHNLTGNLDIDVTKTPQEKQNVDAVSLNLPNAGSYIPTKAEREIYTASTSAGIIPLDLIINTISGRLKKLKKIKALEDLEKKIKPIKNTYENYIIKVLKIKSTDLSRFIYYLESEPGFDKNYKKHQSEFIKFINQTAVEFKKINNYSE